MGYDLSEQVRGAIVDLPEDAWVAALDQDGSPRDNGQVAELTDLELAGWPVGSRVIVRRERPHSGAQLSFTDHDGHRFQAILTDQIHADIAQVERRHRARTECGDQRDIARSTLKTPRTVSLNPAHAKTARSKQ